MDKKESFDFAGLRQLDGLADSLNDLKETVEGLLLENALNPKSASSSRFGESFGYTWKECTDRQLQC
ncbi:MAG: hypothetical protein CM1200mP16_00750 [Nitrospina sp.]|nr:MAG: hypothetical protein CM1200mP16_00750 [Nitrospina sp.]